VLLATRQGRRVLGTRFGIPRGYEERTVPVTERGVLDALPRLLGVTPTGQLLRLPSEEDPAVGPVVEVVGTGRAVLNCRGAAVGESGADEHAPALAVPPHIGIAEHRQAGGRLGDQ
jgi:hypothetical protein